MRAVALFLTLAYAPLLLAQEAPKRAVVHSTRGTGREWGSRSSTQCQPDVSAWRHDGFLLRSEAGVALLEESILVRMPGEVRSRIWGIAQSSTLSIGGTLSNGLVLGVAVWTARFTPAFVEGGRTVVPDDDSVKLTMLRVGPLLDWYPDPTRGLHAQAFPSFIVEIEHDTKGQPQRPYASGLTLGTGLGYEWFVSEQFSLGIQGKWTFGWLRRGAAGSVEQRGLVIPELALTATYQ